MYIYYNPEQKKFAAFRYVEIDETDVNGHHFARYLDNTPWAVWKTNVDGMDFETSSSLNSLTIFSSVRVVHDNLRTLMQDLVNKAPNCYECNIVAYYDDADEARVLREKVEKTIAHSKAEYAMYDISGDEDPIIAYNSFLQAIKDNWNIEWGHDEKVHIIPGGLIL